MRAMSSDPERAVRVGDRARAALRPFRSGLAAASASSRRRAPSSPVIAAEASTQSPFARTLTPEVDVLDGLWFEPDPPEETSGDATVSPAGLLSEEEPDADRRPSAHCPPRPGRPSPTGGPRRWRSVSGRRFSGRRIGAVAGGALGGLALLRPLHAWWLRQAVGLAAAGDGDGPSDRAEPGRGDEATRRAGDPAPARAREGESCREGGRHHHQGARGRRRRRRPRWRMKRRHQGAGGGQGACSRRRSRPWRRSPQRGRRPRHRRNRWW